MATRAGWPSPLHILAIRSPLSTLVWVISHKYDKGAPRASRPVAAPLTTDAPLYYNLREAPSGSQAVMKPAIAEAATVYGEAR